MLLLVLGRAIPENSGLRFGLQQSLDTPPQLVIASAGIIEKR